MNIRILLAAVLMCALSVGSGWGLGKWLEEQAASAGIDTKSIKEGAAKVSSTVKSAGTTVKAGAAKATGAMANLVPAPVKRKESQVAIWLAKKTGNWETALKEATWLLNDAKTEQAAREKAAAAEGVSDKVKVEKTTEATHWKAEAFKWQKEIEVLKYQVKLSTDIKDITKKHESNKKIIDGKKVNEKKDSTAANAIVEELQNAKTNLDALPARVASLIVSSKKYAVPAKKQMDAFKVALDKQVAVVKSLEDKKEQYEAEKDKAKKSAFANRLKTAEKQRDTLKDQFEAATKSYKALMVAELEKLQNDVKATCDKAKSALQIAQEAMQRITAAEQEAGGIADDADPEVAAAAAAAEEAAALAGEEPPVEGGDPAASDAPSAEGAPGPEGEGEASAPEGTAAGEVAAPAAAKVEAVA